MAYLRVTSLGWTGVMALAVESIWIEKEMKAWDYSHA